MLSAPSTKIIKSTPVTPRGIHRKALCKHVVKYRPNSTHTHTHPHIHTHCLANRHSVKNSLSPLVPDRMPELQNPSLLWPCLLYQHPPTSKKCSPLAGKHKFKNCRRHWLLLLFNIRDSDSPHHQVCELPAGFGCFMFHWQRQQTVPAGSCLALLSAGLIISTSTGQHIEQTLLALHINATAMLTPPPPLNMSHLLCFAEVHFTSALHDTRLHTWQQGLKGLAEEEGAWWLTVDVHDSGGGGGFLPRDGIYLF